LNAALKVVDGPSGIPVPVTVTPQDAKKANEPDTTKKEPSTPVEDETPMPGALTDSAPVIPKWYKVGWRDVTGVDAPIPTGEEHDRQVISMFISEQVLWHLCSSFEMATIDIHECCAFHSIMDNGSTMQALSSS
jgi:hypothetical protein